MSHPITYHSGRTSLSQTVHNPPPPSFTTHLIKTHKTRHLPSTCLIPTHAKHKKKKTHTHKFTVTLRLAMLTTTQIKPYPKALTSQTKALRSQINQTLPYISSLKHPIQTHILKPKCFHPTAHKHDHLTPSPNHASTVQILRLCRIRHHRRPITTTRRRRIQCSAPRWPSVTSAHPLQHRRSRQHLRYHNKPNHRRQR